jgi:hypothetical protein
MDLHGRLVKSHFALPLGGGFDVYFLQLRSRNKLIARESWFILCCLSAVHCGMNDGFA